MTNNTTGYKLVTRVKSRYNRLSSSSQTVAKASLAMAFARLIAMMVPFAIVPIALNYLGTERYGLWVAVTSLVIMMMAFSDGGISNAIVTEVSKARAKAKNQMEVNAQVRVIIASAGGIFTPLVVLIILISLILVPIAPWAKILNITDPGMIQDARAVIPVVICGIALGFLVNIVLRARVGLEQIPAVSFWETLAKILALPALIFATLLHLEMVWLVFGVVMAPVFILAFASIIFLKNNSEFIPDVSDFSLPKAKRLFSTGSVYFMSSLTAVMAIQADQLIIAHLVGLEDVATYSIMQRLFGVPWVFMNFIVASQWPTYTSQATKGNIDWVRRSFNKTLLAALILVTIMAVILFATHDKILTFWLGGNISPSYQLMISMVGYAIVLTGWETCRILMISIGANREIFTLTIFMLLVNIPLSIFLTSRIGSAGAAFGTVISYLVCLLIPSAVIVPKLFKSMKNESNFINEENL